jgi:hypothetical protein
MNKILVPDRQIIIPLRGAFRGRWRLEAYKLGGPRRLLGDFPNLITDNGLELMPTGGYLGTCSVGSGNATPTFGDTTLQSPVASTTTTQTTSGTAQPSPPYYGSRAITYRFGQGVAQGNLAEIGIGNGVTLYSRALILDGGGTPTTITVLSDEFLDATYVLENIVPTSDVTGSLVIDGDTYNYTVRAANATNVQWANNSTGDLAGFFVNGFVAYDGAIGAITGLPSGASAGADTVTNGSYSAGSHQIDAVCTFGLNTANFGGGISAFSMAIGQGSADLGIYQCGLDVPIPKDGTKTLSVTFRYSWDRTAPI